MFVTPYNFSVDADANFEHPVGVSSTVPDMDLPLSVLVDRYTKGLYVPSFAGTYSEDEDEFFPDLDALDLADRQDFLERNAARIRSLQDSLRSIETPAASGASQREAGVELPSKLVNEPPEASLH